MKCPRCGGTGQIADPRVEGAAFRQRRVRAGLQLRVLARRAKISAAYLCDLEHGRRRWNEPLRTRLYELTIPTGAA